MAVHPRMRLALEALSAYRPLGKRLDRPGVGQRVLDVEFKGEAGDVWLILQFK